MNLRCSNYFHMESKALFKRRFATNASRSEVIRYVVEFIWVLLLSFYLYFFFLSLSPCRFGSNWIHSDSPNYRLAFQLFEWMNRIREMISKYTFQLYQIHNVNRMKSFLKIERVVVVFFLLHFISNPSLKCGCIILYVRVYFLYSFDVTPHMMCNKICLSSFWRARARTPTVNT